LEINTFEILTGKPLIYKKTEILVNVSLSKKQQNKRISKFYLQNSVQTPAVKAILQFLKLKPKLVQGVHF
jgi:hypothetical protein